MACPIDRVPLEILGEIFLTTAQISREGLWSEGSLNTSYKGPMLVPLRLSQVCRVWRELAMSYSSLWTDIILVVYGKGGTERDERLMEAVDAWLGMSRTAPLKVTAVFNTGKLPNRELDTAAYILNRILGEQARWREVSLTFEEKDPTRLPLINLVDVPSLESLTIRWKKAALNLHQVLLHIPCSPCLKNLSIEGIPPIQTGKLSGMRELYLHGRAFRVSCSALLDMLQNMPGLESLEIGFTLGTLDWSNEECPSITLDKLSTLKIDRTDVSTFITKKLVLPRLKSLACHSLSYEHYEEIINMLKRSQPLVESLKLSDTIMDEDTLIPLFELLPQLKTLRAEHSRITPRLFDALSTTNTAENNNELHWESSVVCPKLRAIHFQDNGWGMGGGVCVHALYNMIQKRCISLGIDGVINYQAKVYDRAGGDGVISHFTVPFAELCYMLKRENLRRASELDILFGHSIHRSIDWQG